MKTRPVAEELLDVDRQTEGRTDRHNNANCPFSNENIYSTNDIRVSHSLTFVMLDTSRIVTPFNALWSHSVTKTVIMLPTV